MLEFVDDTGMLAAADVQAEVEVIPDIDDNAIFLLCNEGDFKQLRRTLKKTRHGIQYVQMGVSHDFCTNIVEVTILTTDWIYSTAKGNSRRIFRLCQVVGRKWSRSQRV
jgi:hypothetical protein